MPVAPMCPELVVNYDPSPTAAPACSQAVYGFGATASLGAPVYSCYENDLTWIEVGLNLSNSDSTKYRGVVGWFASSALIPAPTANWQSHTVPGYPGVFASYSDPNNPTDYGANAIALQPSGCAVYENGNNNAPGYEWIEFSIQFASAFGSQVNVTPDMRFGLGPAGTTTWASGSSFNGALSHPVVSSGWTAEPSDAFSVISQSVNTLTYAGQAPAPGLTPPAAPRTTPTPRAAARATLMWPASLRGSRLPHLPKRRLGVPTARWAPLLVPTPPAGQARAAPSIPPMPRSQACPASLRPIPSTGRPRRPTATARAQISPPRHWRPRSPPRRRPHRPARRAAASW